MKVVGSGSVVRRDRKKDGTLKAQERCRLWDLSLKLEDGGRRTERFEGSYREARAALDAFAERVEREGAEPERGELTFSEYADAWHERRIRGGMLHGRTTDGERYRINAASMHIGGIPLKEVGPSDIEDCYSSLIAGDSPSGRPWKPKSVEDLHKTLSTLFNEAVRDGLLDRPPTRLARRPKVPDAERTVPSRAQMRALEESLDADDPRHLAVILCITCGLRRSEAVALTCADWDGKRLHVHRSSEEDGTPKPPKNVRHRNVPVPRRIAAMLDAKRGRDGDPLIGAWIKPKVLTRWWNRNRDGFGMGGVRLHDLRHAYATRLAEAGVHPRVMMELGGWETIDVCMGIYTHVNSGQLDEAVESAFGE